MKNVVAACALCLFSSSAFADISKDEAKRLEQSAKVLTSLRSAPDKGIPEDLWAKAQCAVVIPSLKKAAFVFGGEYGAGVMSCRGAKDWSAPVFMQLEKGSWGLQIGAEEVDLVLLVMNRTGVDKLLQDKVSLGADASVAAGPVGRTGTAATDAQMSAEMLAYSHSNGVFAGIDVSGGALRPDGKAIARAYGNGITAREIVMGTHDVTVPPQAADFMKALRTGVRGTTGRVR
jgi:lipid-binding SYLF domain-containing protein